MRTFFKQLPVILQKDLQDTWKVYISDPHTSDNLTSLNTASTSTRTSSPQTWNPDIQNQEMIQAGLDSTFLTSFREQLHIPIAHHSYFPPDMPSISPVPQDTVNKFLLHLVWMNNHISTYNPDIMEKFKDLIRKYPEVFYLPGSPLNEIRGFTHFINTGNARPIYRLPYKESPAEIKALRDEIERMLTMQIIQPSKSAWGVHVF